MRNMISRKVATIGLLTALILISIGPAAAQQVSPRPAPAQSAEPFVEMLPGVYVYWQWWNESSEAIGPVPVDIRNQYHHQYQYDVEDIFGHSYRILENSEYNSTNIWSFSNLLVTIIFDPDGTYIRWLSTQPQLENLWTLLGEFNINALSGDEVFVSSSFYYSSYNYSYSYNAEFTWTNQMGTLVDPTSLVSTLKDEYQWASVMNKPQSISSKWHYRGFGYDVSEMTITDNRIQWMQHYFAGLSVFNDTNHDGIMDIAFENTTQGSTITGMPNQSDLVMNQTESELKYIFYAENATMGQVNTPFVNKDGQIEWGAEVTSIDGVLTSPFVEALGLPSRPENTATPIPEPVLARVDSLKMTYDFEVTDEAAVLNIGQYIGNFTNPVNGKILPQAHGLSLALNYWSSFSSSILVPLAGDTTSAIPLTSSPDAEPIPTGGLLFTEKGIPLMMIEFGGTYIWGWDNSVHNVGTAVMPMYFFAYPLTANPPLTNVVSGVVSMFSGSYYYSACYGNWSGYSILHDPVFVAYPGVRPGDVSNRISGIFYATVFLGGAALVVLVGVWIRIARVRKSS